MDIWPGIGRTFDIGGHVFAISDSDKLIREERAKTNVSIGKPGKRFVKQRTEAGWQLLDTLTGKTRPTSPPDSDCD